MTITCLGLRTALLSAGIAAGLTSPHRACADEPLSTDRPDFVESSEVVGPGRVQVETGLSFERDSADGVRQRTRTTPTLLRMGVNQTLELRIETDGAVRSDTQDAATTQRVHGYSDVALGLKWRMQEGDTAQRQPGVAWLADVAVDSGSQAFRGQGLRPSLRVVAEWELPQDLSVGVMTGLAADRNAGGGRFLAGILAITLAKGWTPAWHGFVELAAPQLASHKNGGSQLSLDTGVAYLVTDSVQVDLSVARGLTASAPDSQWGVGLSIRF